MASPIKTEDTFSSVRQINCTGCGAALEVISNRAKYTGCSYCGSVLDLQSEDYKVLKKLGDPERHPPMSIIKMGMKATFNNKLYQVIARTRWKQTYQERWSEDGETGYSDEVWVYDEWLLLCEDRTYFYLVEDKSGFMRTREFVPKQVVIPKNAWDKISFAEKHGLKPVSEIGTAEVMMFEGESNYTIREDDIIWFASYKVYWTDYITEWRIDPETRETKEIEFFQEEPLKRKDVLKAFEDNPSIQAILDKKRNWKKTMNLALYGALGFFLLFLFSFFSGKTLVFEDEIELHPLGQVDPTTGQAPQVYGTSFTIDTRGTYEVEILDNSFGVDGFALVYFMDEDSSAIRYISGDLNSMSVGGRIGSEAVKIDPGTYHTQLFLEHTPGIVTNSSGDTHLSGGVQVKIYSGIMMAWPFFAGLLICLFLAFIFWLIKKRQ